MSCCRIGGSHRPSPLQHLVKTGLPRAYPVSEAKAKYCKQWQGDLMGEPLPLPKRPKRVATPSSGSIPLVDLIAGDDEPRSDTGMSRAVEPSPNTKVGKQLPPKAPGIGTTGDLF